MRKNSKASPWNWIRARFQGDGELRAGVRAVLGRVSAGLYLELLDGFGRGRERYRVDARLGDRDAIESGVLIGVALAIGADADGVARDGHAAAAAAVDVRQPHASAVLHARLQDRQRAQVAAVERQFFHAPRVHHLAQRGLIRVQQGGLAGHFHGLGFGADLHVEVDARLQVQLELDAGVRFRLEARRLDGDGVLARIEQRKVVVAACWKWCPGA